jgi:nucleoside-diphosphate-sugar epimerase
VPEKAIIVTGSAGLIGSCLIGRLRHSGYKAIGIDLKKFNTDICVDICQASYFQTLLKGAIGVVHLAAISRVITGERDPARCWDVNVKATRNLLKAATATRDRPWVLYASSREVYGQQDAFPVREDAPFRPMIVYARSKVAAEIAVGLAREAGLPTAIARFSNVYGSLHDYPDRVIPAFAAAAAKRGELRVEGSCNGLDFTYVEDVVDGILCIVDAFSSGETHLPPVHFVSGCRTTLGELASLAISLGARGARLTESPPRSFDVRDFHGDPRRAQAVLGRRMKTDIRHGLAQLISGFQSSMPHQQSPTSRPAAVPQARPLA